MKFTIMLLVLSILLVAGCEAPVEMGDAEAYEQLICTNGMVNDPYPGSCGMYIDENNNQICDRSEYGEEE